MITNDKKIFTKLVDPDSQSYMGDYFIRSIYSLTKAIRESYDIDDSLEFDESTVLKVLLGKAALLIAKPKSMNRFRRYLDAELMYRSNNKGKAPKRMVPDYSDSF